MKNTIRKFVWLALCGSAMQLAASSPVIGVARSWGAFYVNNASVPGSATVFDGTSVKTADASSNLNLNGGERVMLASNSTAVIHPDRLQLDRGTAEVSGSSAYRVEARNVRIEPSGATARIRVVLDGQNRVLVASLGGTADVRNSQGRLVARLASGAALSLSPGDPDSVSMSGKVTEKDGKFFLTDDVTNVMVELQAKGLPKLVGKNVHVTGRMGTPDGSVDVLIVDSANKKGAAAVATGAGGVAGGAAAGAGGAAAGAGGAAAGAGAAASGLSTLAITGISVGVAGAASVGGLAAAGTIGGSSSVSR